MTPEAAASFAPAPPAAFGAAPAPGDDLGAMGPLVARISRAGQRLRQADRVRPWALDTALLALVFLAFCLPDLLHADDADGPRRLRLVFAQLPPAGILALQAGLVVPLLWRRRRPAAAFGAVTGAFVLQFWLGAALRADVALFIALYSLDQHHGGSCPGPARPPPPPWCWSRYGRRPRCPSGTRCSSCSARRPRPSHSASWCGSDAPSSLGCATAPPVWRSNATSAAGSRPRRNAPGWPATCTTSSATTWPSSSPSPTPAATRAPPRRTAAGRRCASSARRAGSRSASCAACWESSGGREERAELRPQPGLTAVGALCEGVRAAGLDVVYRTAGDVDALDSGVQLTVYRIVQEALTNSLKHAGAGTRVDLEIAAGPSRLTVRVRDSGTGGGDRDRGPANEEGHGLVGMRERVALYRGSLTAGPDGAGWTVEAVLDLTPLGGAG